MSEQATLEKSKEKKPFNQLTVWCYFKKYPCKTTCLLYDVKAEECKILLACNKILEAAKQ